MDFTDIGVLDITRIADYDRSLLSIPSSLLSYYGAKSSNHATLPELDACLLKNHKNVVLLLFDGMGTDILEKHLTPDAFLQRNTVCRISSVFPPTTTAATVSVETGLSPIEHGWLGWSLYFDEVGANVSVFPNTLSCTNGKPAADYSVARRYLPYENLATKIKNATSGEVGAEFVSPFSKYKSKSVADICSSVKSICENPGRQYVYAYWYNPDYEIHTYGTKSGKVAKIINDINRKAEELCEKLRDTLVIITADHGLVDTEWRYLPDYPDITGCLAKMPSVEPRAMSFSLKKEQGITERFKECFTKRFGDCYRLYTHDEVIKYALFGEGEAHLRSEGFLGDYLAVATGSVSIEIRKREEVLKPQKAAHAGATEKELSVPLIIYECPKE